LNDEAKGGAIKQQIEDYDKAISETRGLLIRTVKLNLLESN